MQRQPDVGCVSQARTPLKVAHGADRRAPAVSDPDGRVVAVLRAVGKYVRRLRVARRLVVERVCQVAPRVGGAPQLGAHVQVGRVGVPPAHARGGEEVAPFPLEHGEALAAGAQRRHDPARRVGEVGSELQHGDVLVVDVLKRHETAGGAGDVELMYVKTSQENDRQRGTYQSTRGSSANERGTDEGENGLIRRYRRLPSKERLGNSSASLLSGGHVCIHPVHARCGSLHMTKVNEERVGRLRG
eukprot:2215505-Pleurochrysis_carterae.AAC.1